MKFYSLNLLAICTLITLNNTSFSMNVTENNSQAFNNLFNSDENRSEMSEDLSDNDSDEVEMLQEKYVSSVFYADILRMASNVDRQEYFKAQGYNRIKLEDDRWVYLAPNVYNDVITYSKYGQEQGYYKVYIPADQDIPERTTVLQRLQQDPEKRNRIKKELGENAQYIKERTLEGTQKVLGVAGKGAKSSQDFIYSSARAGCSSVSQFTQSSLAGIRDGAIKQSNIVMHGLITDGPVGQTVIGLNQQIATLQNFLGEVNTQVNSNIQLGVERVTNNIDSSLDAVRQVSTEVNQNLDKLNDNLENSYWVNADSLNKVSSNLTNNTLKIIAALSGVYFGNKILNYFLKPAPRVSAPVVRPLDNNTDQARVRAAKAIISKKKHSVNKSKKNSASRARKSTWLKYLTFGFCN